MYNLIRRLRNVQKCMLWERSAMSNKKMGRPIIGEPKNIRTQIRLDESTLKKLDVLREKEKMSRSEYIRKLINEVI